MFFLEGLKHYLQPRFSTNYVRETYASTPESDLTMRSAMVEVGRVHARELDKKAVFKELIREGEEFAVEFFKSITYQEPSKQSDEWGWS